MKFFAEISSDALLQAEGKEPILVKIDNADKPGILA